MYAGSRAGNRIVSRIVLFALFVFLTPNVYRYRLSLFKNLCIAIAIAIVSRFLNPKSPSPGIQKVPALVCSQCSANTQILY